MAIYLSWAGIILLRGCCVVERDFTETVDTAEEGGTVVSKIGGRFCAVTGGVTLGGRGGTKSKVGFHVMGGRNNTVHSFVGLMVLGGNTSWERMSGSEIMAVRRVGFCFWRRESTISSMLILSPRRSSCIFSASFRLKKYSSIGTIFSGSCQVACNQRSRRELFVSQDESTQPRASSALWIAPASDGRGLFFDCVTVWWLGRGHHKGRSMLDKLLWVIFGDLKVALE